MNTKKKYSKYWFEVYKVVSKAQKDVFEIVRKICEEIKKDIGNYLLELQEKYNFTYVIDPRTGNTDIMKCVPCIYITADDETFEIVKRSIIEKFPELVSDSRLVFEKRPMEIRIE
jgi:hypothetical protein